MVLDYYGIEKSERELAKLANASGVLGVDDATLVGILRSFGLKVKIKNYSTFVDIGKYLDKGIPVIVDWFTRGRNDYPDFAVADGHYSVVVGLDRRFVCLQDPEIGGIRKLARDDFLRVWFDYSGEYLKSSKQMIIRQLIAVYK